MSLVVEMDYSFGFSDNPHEFSIESRSLMLARELKRFFCSHRLVAHMSHRLVAHNRLLI